MQTAGSVVSVWGWTPSRREIVKNPIQGLEGRRGGRGSRPSLVLILLECNQFGQFLALVLPRRSGAQRLTSVSSKTPKG